MKKQKEPAGGEIRTHTL